jgi:hypothetical protein
METTMRIPSIICVALMFLNSALNAKEMSEAELEKWFASDELDPPAYRTSEVNEGELVFLSQIPPGDIHHHQNKLIIDEASLVSGWVRLQQCHHNLDRISRIQITFRKKKVKQIRIVSRKNIEQAWVEDNTVQLRNVNDKAELCIEALTHALVANEDGSYSLRNGPFMRRFLDGYYPMHVSMHISYTGTGLQLASVSPESQQGFTIWQNPEQIGYEAWFEGRLKTELLFYRAAM